MLQPYNSPKTIIRVIDDDMQEDDPQTRRSNSFKRSFFSPRSPVSPSDAPVEYQKAQKSRSMNKMSTSRKPVSFNNSQYFVESPTPSVDKWLSYAKKSGQNDHKKMKETLCQCTFSIPALDKNKCCPKTSKKTIITIVAIVLLVLLAILLIILMAHFASRNTASINVACFDSSTCISEKNLECVLTRCVCKSGYEWSKINETCSLIVIPKTCNTILQTNTINSALFSMNSGPRMSVTTFAGSGFCAIQDLTEVQNNGMFYYIAEDCHRAIVVLNQNGMYVRHVSIVNSIFYIENAFNSIFYTDRGVNLVQLDYNLNTLRTISSCNVGFPCLSSTYGMFYDSIFQLLYVVDDGSKGIHVFDSSLRRVEFISISSNKPLYYVNKFNCSFYVINTDEIFVIQKVGSFYQTIRTLNGNNMGLCGPAIPFKRVSFDAKGNMVIGCSSSIKLFDQNGLAQFGQLNGRSFFAYYDSLGRILGSDTAGIDWFY